MATTNPFAALLSTPNTETTGVSKQLIEEILLFTLRKKPSEGQKQQRDGRALLLLADLIVEDNNDEANMSDDLLAHVLFERLMLTDTQQYRLAGSQAADALETDPIKYLHRAFATCERLKQSESVEASTKQGCEKIEKHILTNASTILQHPELFVGQSFATQWLQVLQYEPDDPIVQDFLVRTVKGVTDESDEIVALGALKAIFYPMFGELQRKVAQASLINMDKSIWWTLDYFVRAKGVPQLGEILIDYMTPNPNAKGGDYMDTMLGQMLCISIMPKTATSRYEYFHDITVETQQSDPALWQLMASHQQAIFLLVKQLLVLSATTKKKTLAWLANCLHANVSRGHLWNNMSANYDQVVNQQASDAFMLGLTAVLLRLCAPLCAPQLKVNLVDPTYCAVSETGRDAKQVSMLKASEETCLLPLEEENEQRVTAEKYNFVTEIFYLTHKAYELGYRVCIERYTRLSRELHNLQNAYQDVVNTDPQNDLAKNLLRMLKEQMEQYLCMRNALMEPENDTHILKLFEASALWLTDLALVTESEYTQLTAKQDYTPQSVVGLTGRPLPTALAFVPGYLKSVPECIMDNIVAYLNFSRHFAYGQYIEVYAPAHTAFFKMAVLYMGSAQLVKNPHLRAKLAEALEFLLPRRISGSSRQSFVTRVFETHEDRLRVVPSLLHVFVSIEMTGQSVQFEQKFNYRRPMYAIMEYLWTIGEQVECFKRMASEAELNMEATEPPLFLRFINLLINDGIFLLDESLSNLQQIRELQEAQAAGEWNALAQHERQQHVSNLHHLGMLARFDNILGRDTINILKLLTTEIKSIFCHNSMVERIAAMLNYFLLHLVEPQHSKKFKVKDKKEFEFDPAQTVMEICRIYTNLACSDAFCLAVSQDGRSYSSQLFGYAENILIRIGGGQLIAEILDFAEKVKKLEAQYKEEQEFLADAPDDYLDPIMNTLMLDPVILPSSHVTVDRTTIVRHLLSDQTDPFNRAPLTMDKVLPNVALKAEIERWISEKRAAGAAARALES